MNKNLFYILMVLAMIFWGVSWVNVKILSSYINEYELIFLRMGISFISMFPILYFFRLSFKIDFKALFLILLASVVLVLYSISFFLGVEHGTAGFGGALVTTLIPINTFIILIFSFFSCFLILLFPYSKCIKHCLYYRIIFYTAFMF